jgi:beta-mannosidase
VAFFQWGWEKGLKPDQAKKAWADYERVFMKTLAEAVAAEDPERAYIRTSPLAGYSNKEGEQSWNAGDLHYWGVWHSKEPFTNYETKIGRFMSEYGFQSQPEPATMEKFLPRDEWKLMSDTLIHHQRCIRPDDRAYGENNMLRYMDDWYGAPRDFNAYLYLTQILQAEGLKMAMESHRRAMAEGFCGGSLFWQINDCWPGASWSSIDYYGRLKALHYYARRAYAELLLSIKLTESEAELWVVSDSRQELPGLTLAAESVNLRTGEKRQLLNQNISVAGLSSAKRGSLNLNEIIGTNQREVVILRARLLAKDGSILADNERNLVEFKRLKLGKADIAQTARMDGGKVGLSLQSPVPVLGLRLTLGDINGDWSDNWLSLYPGEERRVSFAPKGALNLDEFNRALRLDALNDMIDGGTSN